MSARGAIPPSIRDALDSGTGYVITIAGRPGTGKSMLVHEAFREFEDSFLILSNAEATSHAKKELADMPHWEDRHQVAYHWRDVDTTDLHHAPLNEQIEKLLGQSAPFDFSILIIDSWSDFLMPIEESKRYKVQQSLIFGARNEGKCLVLVTEDDNPPLYHSSDAIVNLERLRQDQRMYRQLNIEKMRSMQVKQDTFLFTLNNGRFSYIPWHIHKFPPITVEREPINDPTIEHISTGNRSLDRIIGGGFQKGGLSLIEVENLAAPYLETIYIPFLSNHLQLGRSAVILLPEGWSADRFTRGLSHFVNSDLVKNQVVFFGRHRLGKERNVRAIDDDPWKTLQEIRYESTQLEKEFGSPSTELFALDTLENKYEVPDVKGVMAEITAALPESERAVVTILSMEQALKSGAIAHSVHLRVQELCGVLSVCGVIPRTNYLAVSPILSKGFLDYELIPIE
jgi:KaiC/GvpD/RAD55 family RecA-like ATPase